jgi:hypothetical protein
MENKQIAESGKFHGIRATEVNNVTTVEIGGKGMDILYFFSEIVSALNHGKLCFPKILLQTAFEAGASPGRGKDRRAGRRCTS